MSKFVIRGYHWGYNDETFYPCGSYVKTIFDSEDKAKKEKIKLEREHWSEFDLGESNQFFDTDQALINQVNEFVKSKLGYEIFTSDDRRDTFIPNELDDNDFEQFLAISHLSAYKLTKFEDEPKFYAIWLNQADEYLMEYDECSTALVFGASMDELKNESEETLEDYFYDNPETLKGDINAITESPVIMQDFLGKSSGLSYDDEEKCISIDDPRDGEIFALNEFLKTPIFSIKILSLKDVMDIQNECVEEC